MATAALVQTTEKTNIWLKELTRVLDWDDPDMVFNALRTVLHHLRDRLPLNESAQLASQLPMLIRGCYYENWVPKQKTEHLNAQQFVARVGMAFPGDLSIDPEEVVRAVFDVISWHVSAGEVKDVKSCLPEDLRELWP